MNVNDLKSSVMFVLMLSRIDWDHKSHTRRYPTAGGAICILITKQLIQLYNIVYNMCLVSSSHVPSQGHVWLLSLR